MTTIQSKNDRSTVEVAIVTTSGGAIRLVHVWLLGTAVVGTVKGTQNEIVVADADIESIRQISA